MAIAERIHSAVVEKESPATLQTLDLADLEILVVEHDVNMAVLRPRTRISTSCVLKCPPPR